MSPPLPPPGPDYYAARRARWLTSSHSVARQHLSPSQTRLQRLLAHPHPHRDPVWKRGIDKAWKGLIDGNRLKHPLPMSILVIHAAWRRDLTIWPESAVVPDSDESRTITPSLPTSPSILPS